MSHRQHQKKNDFEGRTIKRVDTSACNTWHFYFEDGGVLAIEVDAVAPGIYGLVICDECTKDLKGE